MSKKQPVQKKANHIKYESIEQFKNVLHDLKEANITNIDFEGTVKLHGTNAAVCYNKDVDMYVQSRSSVISVQNDNAGFAAFVEKRKKIFMELIQMIEEKYRVDTSQNTICIYGEFCGGNIQKGVAIQKLPKCFVIFDAKICSMRSTKQEWLDISTKNKKNNKCIFSDPTELIYNIHDFKTYKFSLDMSDLNKMQDFLETCTQEVEDCCPFAHQLGVDGVGEGIVWRSLNSKTDRIIFKTKGTLHQVTKEKTVVPVNTEKVASANEFVEKVCTLNRFNQAIESLYKSNPESPLYKKEPELKHCSNLLEWIKNDILKEEKELMSASNLNEKMFTGPLAKKVLAYLKNHMQKS